MNKIDRSSASSSPDVRHVWPPSRVWIAGWIGCAIWATALGCSKPVEIRQYQVDKPPHRMLAAIVTREDRKEAWFFKLSGPRQAIAAQISKFQSLLESVEFPSKAETETPAGAAEGAKDEKPADGPSAKKPAARSGDTPQWKLPEGWKQTAGATGERFATIQVPGEEDPLELTVTRLPMPARGGVEYKLQNVNRWRQQMKLGPIDLSEFARETKQLKAADGLAVTWVDLAGTLAPPRRPMEGGGPFAAGMGGGMGAGGMGPVGAGGMPGGMGASGGPASVPFDYEAPAEWTAGPTNSLRRLSYKVEDGGEQAEITVIVLPADANDLLSNINRWREQVGLNAVNAAELKSLVKALDMGGVPGAYVELVGAGEAATRESILGVMAVNGDQAWFFKFKGPDSLAQREKTRFESFIKSVRFHEAE